LIDPGCCGKLFGRKSRHGRLVDSWADGPYPFDRSARGAPDSGRDAPPRRMNTRSDGILDSSGAAGGILNQEVMIHTWKPHEGHPIRVPLNSLIGYEIVGKDRNERCLNV
jgi:hypothetical protein